MRTNVLPRLLAVLLAVAGFTVGARAQLAEVGDGGPGPVKADHLTVELTSLAPAVAPRGQTTLGLVFSLQSKWHVYWINPGDAGEPPRAKWTVPTGLTLGPQQFPVPSRLPLGPLMDYGYEDAVTFPFTLSAAAANKPGKVHLDAHVTWLVCRETCIPGKAHLGLDLNVQPGAAAGPLVGAVAEGLNNLPKPLPAGFKVKALGGAKEFILTLDDTGAAAGAVAGSLANAEFYPFDDGQIVNAAKQTVEGKGEVVQLRMERSPDLKTLPASLHGILKVEDNTGYEINVTVVPGEAPPSVSANAGGAKASGTGITAISAIGLALLGGIILNLMPCVFPVLFLKGLALVQSSGEERKRMRGHGLVYTLGILVSFWVIVAVLLVLRAGGKQAGWGFQLQSPAFIAVLAAFLFFFALSLAGQFDLGLSLTSAGGDLARKEGYAGSFFTGVLATIVATPCTAPLMGAAIGFALAQPAGITFAVFTALGLGLALPYLLLTLQPAWTRILPRPGAWMEVLKQLTAVPLFATVIWLTWVYGRLFTTDTGQGADHIARLLFCFLVLAIAGWALGRWPARRGATIAAVLLCAAALAVPLTSAAKDKLTWLPYSDAAFQQARTAGRPVFIDYTAAWCLSCQVNEKVVLRSADVEHALESHHFVLIRADWTQYDPAITAQLKAVNRSGVPTYVVYAADPGAKPDVLPELLTRSLVLDAIAQDTK
jgi:thiol:disulfide interchange protein